MFVGVALDKVNNAADKLYTYSVPRHLEERVCKGVRITVPFGRGNSAREGIVVDDRAPSAENAKSIYGVVDENPIITEELLSIAKFVRETSFCTWYQAINSMLPLGMRIKVKTVFSVEENALFEAKDEREIADMVEISCGKTDVREVMSKKQIALLNKLCREGKILKSSVARKNLRDMKLKSARLCVDFESACAYVRTGRNPDKQQRVIDVLSTGDSVPVTELAYLAGVSQSVVSTLEKHGIVEIFDMQVTRNPYREKENVKYHDVALNAEQETVKNGLVKLYDEKTPNAALLYGVTGSGKTAVYMKLIEHAVQSGGNVILLVPEIALTPQVTDRFVSRFGQRVAVLHSGMSDGERHDQWRRVKNGEATIVIGTRSAVFAPFESVALVVIDEEQESTYRSESAPRYNAKDVAKFRIARSGGTLLLVSATPSVETFAMAKSGRYSYFELPERFGESELPKVSVTNLSLELERGNTEIIGATLKAEIAENLERGEQTILFLNRRGYNTVISCRSCGHVFECPRCSVPMTFHKANGMLMCHYCGYIENLATKCPQCGGTSIKYVGSGTQKLDEEIKRLFPNARTARMDLDTTSYKMAHEKILAEFEQGKYDILVGTQMVTKGLNLPNVTLVGILLADGMLFSDDFRANERAFSMLTQVCGRAGRAERPGRAVIQTYVPDNKTILMARKQDYKAFFEEEIAFRKIMRFPPFCDIYQIVVSDGAENVAKGGAEELCKLLATRFDELKLKNIIMYPALPAAVSRVAGKYRYRILIKCRDNAQMRQIIRQALCETAEKHSGLIVNVDLNPQVML